MTLAIKIQTARTLLRCITSSDLEAIHSLHALPEVDTYNTLGIPKDIEETQRVIAPWIEAHSQKNITNYTFAIMTESAGFIGLFGLKIGSPKYRRAEVWYKIHPDYWNQGYATETLKGVLAFGFNSLKLHRIQAGCAVDNLGSIKVLEKAGMVKEGRGRQILPLAIGWSDNYEYAILDTDNPTGSK